MRIRLPNKSKSKSYAESFAVDVTGRWRERLRSYLGRSHRHEDFFLGIMVETRFTVRSQQKP